MPKPKTGFARRAEFFDRIAADPNLSRAAIVVAWRLINHINDETGECFPSLERLAGQLHIHTRTVRRVSIISLRLGGLPKHGVAGAERHILRTTQTGQSCPKNRTMLSKKPDRIVHRT